MLKNFRIKDSAHKLRLSTRAASLTVFFYLLIPAEIFSAQENPVPLMVKADQIQESSVLHYFGNQDVEIPVMISGNAAGLTDFQTQMFQLSFSLEAALGEPMPVGFLNEKAHFCSESHLLKVFLPHVERETMFTLRFSARREIADEIMNIGEIHLRVYPNNLLDDLKRWAQNVHLRVNDPDGQLESFLKTHGIEFADFRSSMTAQKNVPIVSLVVFSDENYFPGDDDSVAGQAVLFFHEKEPPVPYVEVLEQNNSRRIDVKMKLAERLANDPRAQKIFLEIIHLSTK